MLKFTSKSSYASKNSKMLPNTLQLESFALYETSGIRELSRNLLPYFVFIADWSIVGAPV